MSSDLLRTKLYAPPLRRNQIHRARLVQKLQDSFDAGAFLGLICAPAGFGKTALVSEWLWRGAGPTAWLTLDEDDDSPIRFWRHVVAALQDVDPALGRSVSPLLQSSPAANWQSIATALLADVAEISTPFTLILDDYHAIQTESIHKGLSLVLDHAPAPLRLILITRSDPPLQLARRRVQGDLCEIRAADLRFTPEECGEFLNHAMRLGLDAEEVGLMEQRTEGWIAGLQMAALSLQGVADPRQVIAAFGGDDRFVADYLVEEVLQRQPQEVQTFLLQTSILDRMSGPLCDAVTGRTDGQSMLVELDRANLFTVPLDNRRVWFRYHRLFANLLNRLLRQAHSPAEINDLYGRAGAWLVAQDRGDEAVRYLLAAQSYDLAADLVESVAPEMFARSELPTLLSWGQALPDALIGQRTRLCLIFGWAANATPPVTTMNPATIWL